MARRPVARSVLFITALAALLLPGLLCPAEGSERRKLKQPAEFDGISCKRYAWLNEDGSLDSCFLAQDTLINGQELPAGTKVGFDDDGNPGCVFLPGDTEIQGHLLRGHGHDYQTCFHPNGQLKFGNLTEAEQIQGVPCKKATFFIWVFVGNAGLQFHDNGALKGCLLDEDYEHQGQKFKHGQRIELDRDGNVVSQAREKR